MTLFCASLSDIYDQGGLGLSTCESSIRVDDLFPIALGHGTHREDPMAQMHCLCICAVFQASGTDAQRAPETAPVGLWRASL